MIIIPERDLASRIPWCTYTNLDDLSRIHIWSLWNANKWVLYTFNNTSKVTIYRFRIYLILFLNRTMSALLFYLQLHALYMKVEITNKSAKIFSWHYSWKLTPFKDLQSRKIALLDPANTQILCLCRPRICKKSW